MPAQASKLLRMAVKAASVVVSGVPRASIMKLWPRVDHQMHRPPVFLVRT